MESPESSRPTGRMRRTFLCDESMIITIPIGGLRDGGAAQLMPDKFHCVYRDFYKVFSCRGKPKPLGAAQAIAGVFIVSLGLVFGVTDQRGGIIAVYTLPSVVFMVAGLLTYAAGRYPNMHVAKLSFSFNILSFLWSIIAVLLSLLHLVVLPPLMTRFYAGITGLVMLLLVLEKMISLFLIYWLSKAVCRDQFNTLPIILLKQGD